MKPEELKEIAVLSTVENDVLARLAAVLEEKNYGDGQSIFAEGDAGEAMYFILDGRVRIEKRAQVAGAAQKILVVLETGDYFGEMALLDQKPRSASAVAAGSARILRLSKRAFDEIQRDSSAAGMSVLFAMIRTSSERIRRLSTQVVVYDEVGKAIGEARDLQKLLEVILNQLFSATEADWGLLLLRSQFSERFEIRCQANLTLTPPQREAVNRGDGFLIEVLREPTGRVVAVFGEEEPFKSCTRLGFETDSLLISPIAVEGQTPGVILLGSKQRGHFDLNALNLARGVARQAGAAILNARHHEEEQARSRHSRQFVRF